MTDKSSIDLDAVALLVDQLASFIDNPAEDKTIRLNIFHDYASVSTETYTSIMKSGKVVASSEELMQQTAIIMKADHRDSHNGYTSAETVAKACESYNENCDGAMSILHALAVDSDTMQMVESYIAPKDFTINNSEDEVVVNVQKGDWVGTAQYNNEFFWTMAKNGDLDSFSIEAEGVITYDEAPK